MEKKNVKIIVIAVLAAILVGVVVYGTNKYLERKNAEKLLNQVFDMKNQMITEGSDTADKFLNSALNVYNNIEKEQEKEFEVKEEQIIENFENEKQEMKDDLKNKQQEMLQDVQNKQQEMIQNSGSEEQQQMLQDAQKMQQQMLQMMQ